MDEDYEQYLVDIEALLVQLLRPLLDGVTVLAALDITHQATFPLVALSPGTATPVEDAPEGYGWNFTVSFNITANSRSETFQVSDRLHKALHGFGEYGASVEGLGHIGSITTQMAPVRTGSTQVGGVNPTEYLAVYGVEVIQ